MNAQSAIHAPRRSTHPGEILKEDVLPALNIGASAAAKELGISRQSLHRLMPARRG